MTKQQLLNTNDETITETEISHLVTEDDTPVDNFQSEKQQRLLVEPLYSAQALSSPFLVAANVGLFYDINTEPIVPDVLLSLGVQLADDFSLKQNRSYFVKKLGKVPEVCLEIVSNDEGNELTLSKKAQQAGKKLCKKDIYTQIPIPYYVVFDPLEQIQDQANMNGALVRVWKYAQARYVELTEPAGIVAIGQSIWLEEVGLGLTLWSGEFEDQVTRLWLRWCDRSGLVIPTGAEATRIQRQWARFASEQAAAERQRAESERQRAELANEQAAAERQRAELANKQAESERQRAELANERAEFARQRAEQLAAQLRALGITLD
jgi:hypothetical protein